MKTSDLEFKKNLESITYEDVLKMRQAKEKHALKLDELEIDLKTANEYVEVIKDFLSELNFNEDRIEAFECRRRDGFIPHSHNKGGLEGVTYRDEYSCSQNTGFENADAVLAKYSDYNLENFAAENGLDKDKYSDWTDDQREEFSQYEAESEDTVQFQARVMFTSETTANVDFYVSASDTPYHRQSDDKLELEIEFKTPAGLKRKLKSILKNDFVKCLATNIREGF